jgi:hypothetical protein
MNLICQKEEKLDNMPNREKFVREKENYWGKNFPRSRMMRWLKSCVGKDIDFVISDYVNADWIPDIYRNIEFLKRYIQLDTFVENGEIGFCTDYSFFGYLNNDLNLIKNQKTQVFYLHPVTKKLCVHNPAPEKSWKKRFQEKQDKKLKILGDYHQLYKDKKIWYEVKAEPTFDLSKASFINGEYIKKMPREILLEPSPWYSMRNTKIPYIKITQKRQISKKELKLYGLTNG